MRKRPRRVRHKSSIYSLSTMMLKLQGCLLKALFVTAACISLSLLFMTANKNVTFMLMPQADNRLPPKCTNVLESMLKGKWAQRSLSDVEQHDIEQFLLKARNGHSLPPTLDRPDGKCGNVTFDALKRRYHPLLWFRALCNPKGHNPCCQNGHCTAASESQCRCENCFDLRQQIHAEYSKWIPTQEECISEDFTTEKACTVLKGSSLIFIGDSFVRHIYTALLLLLTNNFQYGALQTQVSAGVRSECRGMLMFTEKICRDYLNRTTTLCQGTVKLRLMEKVASTYGPSFPYLAKSLSTKEKSMLIMGIGIHENYKASVTKRSFLDPLLKYMYKSKQHWPKVVWAGPHAPGLLKTPRVPQQNYQSVLRYNGEVNRYLQAWGVPVFDTFNLTDGVMSFDGAHYGIGVNLVKVNVLLHYVQELIDNRNW